MSTKAKIIKEKTPILDTLQNLVSGLGTKLDKSQFGTSINNKKLSRDENKEELNALYRTDWVAAKIVDIIPDDMTREWRSFIGGIEPETVELLVKEEERLKLSHSFNLAHKWARLYGTSFIVLAVDDGKDPSEPLELDSIRPGMLKHIKPIDKYRINSAEQIPIADPLDPNYGKPEFYRFNETSVRIHNSRVLRFDARELPFDEFRENNYFSDSVLAPLYETIRNFKTVADNSASLVYESNVGVYKVKGLLNYLQSADGEALIKKRFTLANFLKSVNNAQVLDQEEEYVNVSKSFTGLPELLDRYALYISGGGDIPATRLLGSSASGLNATGEGDQNNYYDTVKSKQILDYKPKLDYFDIIMAKNLGLPDNVDLSYEFDPLFQLSEKERAEVEEINSRRDSVYLDRNVITEAQAAKELKQDGTYTNITDEHIEELESFESIETFQSNLGQEG